MENQRKPLIYYWLIALLIMFGINWLLLPLLSGSQVEQVGYNIFLDELEAKNIDQVEVNTDVIYYSLKAEHTDTVNTEISVKQHNEPMLYTTVRMKDDMLVNRLYEAGANFSAIAPKEVSPWVSTLVMFLLFFLFWRFVFGRMMKKSGLGGNAMAFGKSSAKIYVKAQTGKTFQDVAGQDEAKEALLEIVDFLHNPEKYTNVKCQKVLCWLALREQEKHCWHKQWQGKQMYHFSLYLVPNLWKCLWAWVLQKCVICSNKQMKKPLVLSLLMKLIPLGKNVTAMV